MKFIIVLAVLGSFAGANEDGGEIIHEIFEEFSNVFNGNAAMSAVSGVAGAILGVIREDFDAKLAFKAGDEASACELKIGTDMGTPQPLRIRPGTSQWFHPATRNGRINMNANQEMELFCTTGFATPAGITGNSINVACQTGTTFRYNNVNYTFKEFTCRDWPTSTPRRRIGTARCFNNGIYVDVGFTVGARFIHTYTVCHDLMTEVNYFSQYSLSPASDGHESGAKRPNWLQADFYPGKKVDNLYTRLVERRTIGDILNSQDQASIWIEQPPSDVFLSRGHLAANSDFISANEQRSTFYFINIAPQFQTFNGLNWAEVENSARRLASDRNISLDVWTGTVGVGQLKDSGNTYRDIFLAWPSRQIAMPRLYYKILFHRTSNSGVVLIGINNPHLTVSEILANYIICKDVSQKIKYVSWQRTNLMRGYCYACEVNDFERVVPHIPGLHVANLLI